MIGGVPYCLTCKHFKGHPKKCGDCGHCKTIGDIPERIYWDGGKCDSYEIRPEEAAKLSEIGIFYIGEK